MTAVKDLRPGDVLDLDEDPFIDMTENIHLEFEYVVVLDVFTPENWEAKKAEHDLSVWAEPITGQVVIWTESDELFAWPDGHEIKVVEHREPFGE